MAMAQTTSPPPSSAAPAAAPSRAPSKEDRNIVFIGNKPPMAYVLAVVTVINGGAPRAVIRARGNAISRAVSVAEMVRNKFVERCVVENVKIGTERVQADNGRSLNVSTIEIHLAKQA